MTREQKKQKRNEVLTIMGLMALLVFTTRLWPILLLMMIGVFAYALWLLFHLEKQPEPPSPLLLGRLHQFRRKRYWPTHFRYCRGGSLSRSLPGTLTPNGFGQQQMPGSVLKRAEN